MISYISYAKSKISKYDVCKNLIECFHPANGMSWILTEKKEIRL